MFARMDSGEYPPHSKLLFFANEAKIAIWFASFCAVILKFVKKAVFVL